jgi:hypothetical protein
MKSRPSGIGGLVAVGCCACRRASIRLHVCLIGGADFSSDHRCDLGPEQFDGTHDLLMWKRSDAELQEKALVAEDLVLK